MRLAERSRLFRRHHPLASCVGLFCICSAAPAAIRTVTNLNDSGGGSLRDAIAAAASGDTITFALTGTIALTSGDLLIDKTLTITGPGARELALSADSRSRVFSIGSTGQATIAGLTIRDGYDGGIPGAPASGAGILNQGTLMLNDCLLDHHLAQGGAGLAVGGAGGSARGGGVFNDGTLTLNRCTFRSCVARGGAGALNDAPAGSGGRGGDGFGGAVFNNTSRTLTLNNCTLVRNSCGGGRGGASRFGGGGGHGHGGAVYSLGTMTVTSTTVSGNAGAGGLGGSGIGPGNDGSSGAGSGGLTAGATTAIKTLRSTLCAGNSASGFSSIRDVSGGFASGGFNLLGSIYGSTGLALATDQAGTDAAPLNPLLGPLQNNGGPTDTLLLLAGSPAIDRGKTFGLTTDQRGSSRPLDALNLPNAAGGDGSDTGAVEADTPQSGSALVVTTLDDHDDGTASYLDCTLREAVAVANGAAGPATITFAPGLTGTLTMKPGAGMGAFQLTDSTTLIGPGPRLLTILGTGTTRVFQVIAGANSISGLTIRNGQIFTAAAGSPSLGGGLLNQATLALSDCTVRDNIVSGGSGAGAGSAGAGGFGGGVANTAGGVLTVSRCTFSGNAAAGGDGSPVPSPINNTGSPGGPGRGGAIYNDAGCSLTIENGTFFNNHARGGNGGDGSSGGPGGPGGSASGGAIANAGTMTLTSLTLRGNGASGGGGGFGDPFHGAPGESFGGGLLALSGVAANGIRNTLCAANVALTSGRDVQGPFTSGGFNLVGTADGSTGFTAPGDQTGATAAPLDPLLGPLQNNGGHTDTLAPQPGSPTLDRGNSVALATDQRGAARTFDDPALANAPGGDGTDIGAMEARPVYDGPPFILDFSPLGSGQRLLVQGRVGSIYQLQTTSDLATPLTNSGPPAPADALGQIEFIDPGPLPTRRFYRAMQVP